jgi:hypothetical protein
VSAPPGLRVWLDGAEIARLAPPPGKGRAWWLGVVAVQATVERGRVSARLRAHVTGGGAPSLWPLADAAVVQVALDPAPLALPALPALSLEGSAALALAIDGEEVARAALEEAALAAAPSPRAFAHVFCRWLRDGGCEPGCDLTSFQVPPPGEKYTRIAARPLAPGEVATILWRRAGPW